MCSLLELHPFLLFFCLTNRVGNRKAYTYALLELCDFWTFGRFLDEAKTKKCILPCTPLAVAKIMEYTGVYDESLPIGDRLQGGFSAFKGFGRYGSTLFLTVAMWCSTDKIETKNSK